MTKKDAKHVILVFVVISILLSVQLIHFWEPGMEAVPTDFGQYEKGETDLSSGNADAKFEDKDPEFDLPNTETGHFKENQGQWEDHILFLAKTSFGYIGLGDEGVFYYVLNEDGGNVVNVIFQNAERTSPFGREDAGYFSNYFYGNDPGNWVREARSFEGVVYEDVWPGIDILYFFKDGNLKYDIIVDEHADPGPIVFHIEGHKGLDIEDNTLVISISEGVYISDSDLAAFYEDGSSETVRFKTIGDSGYGFEIDKKNGKKLTIDPIVFSSSTFLGGSGGDIARDVAVDGNSDIIITGTTTSNDFPNTTGAFQNSNAGFSDIIVTKLDANATSLIFSTYIGDWSSDYPFGVDLDDSGDIYVTGETWSWYFPTTNGSFQPKDPSMSYPDAFVLKVSSSGSDLIYSTYVGGTQSDGAKDIKVLNGYAYVVGNALSYDFPTAGPGVGDPHGTVFFFIMNQDGTNLTHSAFWGGFSNEFGHSLAIDLNNDVVVGGVTFSLDFPTTLGAYQESADDIGNGFLLKYRPSTSAVVFSTYIGGSVGDAVYAVQIDGSLGIYFSGTTSNPGTSGKPFPTTWGVYDTTINGSRDAFIAKMSSDGANLIYSTFIGGEGDENVGSIDLDGQGNVIFTGSLDSDVNFSATPDAFDDTYNQEGDALFAILKADWSTLLYCTYLGGNASDSGEAAILSGTDGILVLGSTGSMDFPATAGVYQTENMGGGDIFLTKFRVGNLIFLHEGWNLISVPLVPTNMNINPFLSSISGYYDVVQWYEPISGKWQHHHVSKPPTLNTLWTIDHHMGFWVHITEPGGVLFEYSGDPPGLIGAITLYKGWNAVGYPASQNMQRDATLNPLAYGIEVDSIWYFDAEDQTWREMDRNGYFVLGRGYWIHATQDCVWVTP
jgi:hypothetical protein